MRTETKTIDYAFNGADYTYEADVKIVTVREVFESIKENGFEHLRGSWSEYDGLGAKITGGCVLMQGGLNLGAIATHDDLFRVTKIRNAGERNGYYKLAKLEDKLSALTLHNQLNSLPAPTRDSGSKWYSEQSKFGVGSTIIYWNDLPKYDNEVRTGWELETYAEVVEMARDLLEPHFDTELTLLAYEYDAMKKEPVPA